MRSDPFENAPWLSSASWASGAALALAGLLAVFHGRDPTHGILLGAGLAVLALRGLADAVRRESRPRVRLRASLLLGTLVALTGAAVASVAQLPPVWRVLAGVTGAQGLLVALGPIERQGVRHWVVPALGHATALLGSALLALGGTPFSPGAALAHAAGLSLLALHAHWAQRADAVPSSARRREGWETVLLSCIVLAAGALTVPYAASLDLVPLPDAAAPLGVEAALAAAVVGLALLCAPPPAPRWLRSKAGVALDVLAHGAAAIALLNVLFLGLSFVSGFSLRLLFGVLFAWQLLVIGMEMRTLRHAERRRRRGVRVLVAPDAREPVTVIVPAANEASVLPASMERNLKVPYPLRFVLVPATKSVDATVEAAHRIARENPDRVRVVEGVTGSKAEDLNLAWRDVETPFVLLLDADETIDERSLLHGLQVLREDPSVGLVQGRKVSRAPDDGWLARFVSAERRYSTWMDHVMHGEDLGSSHFGGSAALLRREVPPALGGWTDQTLTEDIEFTLRLHLQDRWRLVYHPEMVVRESDPATFQDLLRQRTRWARGWAQCFALYFPKIVRARHRLGRRRAFGLVLLLLIAVSALWTTLVPATLLLRLAGISPILPIAVAVPLTLLLLPGRLLAYGYAALRDPVIPMRFTPQRFVELAGQAYLWIMMGWFVQLHALYLEFSSAPRVWYVTCKRSGAARVPVGGGG